MYFLNLILLSSFQISMSAEILKLAVWMHIVLIHLAITHVPAPMDSMAILMMVVMILMNVTMPMSVVLVPFVLTWRAVIAATALQVMKAMDVRKLDVLILMNVHVRLVDATLNVWIQMVVLGVCVQMATQGIRLKVVKVSVSFLNHLQFDFFAIKAHQE